MTENGHTMDFSYENFRDGWMNGDFCPPKRFAPYTGIDPRKYHEYKSNIKENKKLLSIDKVLKEVEKRADAEYCRKLIPLARFSMDYAADTFPAFELLYPEVIADDWLAMTGWHHFQRDHLIHQPLTAYTVLRLLRGWGSDEPFGIEGTTLLEHCVDAFLFNPECEELRKFVREMGMGRQKSLFCESVRRSGGEYKKTNEYQLWKLLFVETAFLAAMFHDIGYPWQYVRRLSRALHGTNSSLGLHHGNHDIGIGDFKTRLLYSVLKGYQISETGQPLDWNHIVQDGIKSGFEDTHGLPGAFTFLLLSDIFRDYANEKGHTSPFRRFVIEWAAVAICMHDMGKVYRGRSKTGQYPERPALKVRFERDPLSAILCLADFIQDFERHQVAFESREIEQDSEQEMMSHESFFQFVCLCKKTTLCYHDRRFNIIFHQPKHSSIRLKKHHLMKETQELFSPVGFLDFTALGIKEVGVQVKDER